MKKIFFSLFSFLFLVSIVNAQQEHVFIYKSLLLPIHNKAKEVNLNLGYRVNEGINIDASYSINKKIFTFASITADVFPKTESLYPFKTKYKTQRDNYAFSTGMGIYSNRGRFYSSLLGGISANRVNNNVRPTFSKKQNTTYTKVAYASPFLQAIGMFRTKNIDLGITSKFTYNLYGNIKSHNKFYNHNYTYSVKKSYAYDIACIFGVHISKINLYSQLGISKMILKTSTESRKEFLSLIQIGINYSIDYKK